jgi:hypothetical protein
MIEAKHNFVIQTLWAGLGPPILFFSVIFKPHMNYRNIISIAFLSLAAASCTCREEVKAYIKDAETREPVKDVKVRTVGALKGNYKEGTTKFTDSNGRFVAQYDISGVGKCPTTKIFITKDGYEDISVIEPQTGDTIYINKIQ